MRILFLLISFQCLLALPPSCLAQEDSTGTQPDSAWTQPPKVPGKSLGSYLLDLPEETLKLPVYFIKGIGWIAINGIYRNAGLRTVVSQLAAFEQVEGLKPLLGYGANKGFKYGLGLQFFDTFRERDDLLLKGSYSLNKYQKHSIRYISPTLFSEDAGVQFLLQYQTRAQEGFYGIGNETRSDDEVAFYLEETSLELDGLWLLASGISLAVNGGYLVSNTFDGDSRDRVNSLDSMRTLFALSDLDTRNSELVRIGGTFDHDWRNTKGQPSSGGRETISVSHSKGIGKSSELAFITARAEVTHYLNIYRKRLLAARIVAQSINASGDTPVIPFQLRSALGGVELLRGYTTGRFIDYDLTAAAIEYRWPIWDVIDAFLFAEAGRVYDSLSDEFTFKNWHETFGTGLRVWNGDGVILLLQAAVGDEQTQFYFELGGEW